MQDLGRGILRGVDGGNGDRGDTGSKLLKFHQAAAILVQEDFFVGVAFGSQVIFELVALGASGSGVNDNAHEMVFKFFG